MTGTDLIELRRTIHRRPELAGAEGHTAGLVADRLRAAGLAVRTGVGGHGVVAVLDGAAPGPTVAYRADLDACAGDEVYPSDFASVVPGAAHLCGHDVHTAIGVGVAEWFAAHHTQVAGRVVFLFQPAEETLEGAQAMIDDGVLDPAPDEIYAVHCAPAPVGTFAVLPGLGQPGLDVGVLRVPAAEATGLFARIAALSTIAPPATPDALARMVGDLLTPAGPLAEFVWAGVVPDEDTFGADDTGATAWVRTWPPERHAEVRGEIHRLVDVVRGARVEFPRPPFPAMICSPELSHAAADHLRGVPGVTDVLTMQASWPFNGEDFALFLQRVPGAMVFLGVADPAAGINGVPHAPDFAADERAIDLGVRAMATLLQHRLQVLADRPATVASAGSEALRS